MMLALVLSDQADVSCLDADLLQMSSHYGVDVAAIHLEATGEPLPEVQPPPTSLAEVAPTPPEAAQAQKESAAEAQTTNGPSAWPFGEEPEPPAPEAAPAAEDKAEKSGRVAAVYANPENAGQTWTGRGRKPAWVVEALTKGKTLTDLEIKAAQAESKSNGKAAGAAKKPEAKAEKSGGKAAGHKTK